MCKSYVGVLCLYSQNDVKMCTSFRINAPYCVCVQSCMGTAMQPVDSSLYMQFGGSFIDVDNVSLDIFMNVFTWTK